MTRLSKTIHNGMLGMVLVSAIGLAVAAPGESKKSAGKPGAARAVFVNGASIPVPQLTALEQQYRTRIADGRYWYDRVSGAWGMEGGPALGVIPAGMNLGGPLKANASGGGNGRLSGVFINGRELHPQDIAALQTFTATPPGRYWVDAQGNGGHEGGPATFNLYYLAQQAARSRGGNSWIYRNEMTGIGAGGQGGCTYVMGKDFSASSGC
jgi:hypothetical protein